MTYPVTNTHVHFPPNFSAYDTPQEAVQAATDQGVAAMGISNFYDQSVYETFRDLASQAGIVPLYGLEFITLDPELEAQGTRVNDPANPGRMYFCGKGISPFKTKTPRAAQIAAEIRQGNDERAQAMLAQLTDWFASHGLPTDVLTPEFISTAVAERGNVPVDWVSLQERHLARAVQEAVSQLDDPAAALEVLYGEPSAVDVTDAVALQGEIRSRLLKSGTPGFAPEVPLSFADAYQYILEMGGIPTYPTLADGVDPICEYEADADALANALVARNIFAAEIIPIRNKSALVDRYVKAFTDAGMIVMGGTEHNTLDRIPLDPAAVDGPISEYAREKFWEAACVVAAHQALVAKGEPGYVDSLGNRTEVPAEDLIAVGAELIKGNK